MGLNKWSIAIKLTLREGRKLKENALIFREIFVKYFAACSAFPDRDKSSLSFLPYRSHTVH